MDLKLYDAQVFEKYKSNSQRIRVVTENWFNHQMYCPCCLNPSIKAFPNNHKGFDFFCPNCKNQFQLKSSKKEFKKKVLDGEYNTMKRILLCDSAPNFLSLFLC